MTFRIRTPERRASRSPASSPLPSYTTYTTTFYRTYHGPGSTRSRARSSTSTPPPAARTARCVTSGTPSSRRAGRWWLSIRPPIWPAVQRRRASERGRLQLRLRRRPRQHRLLAHRPDSRSGLAEPIRGCRCPGTGRYDWRGYLSPRRWPSVVDPAPGLHRLVEQQAPGVMGRLGRRNAVGRLPALAAADEHARRSPALQPDGRCGRWPAGSASSTSADARLQAIHHRSCPSHFHLSSIERAAVAADRCAGTATAFYPAGAQRGAAGRPTGLVKSPGFAILNAWFSHLENLRRRARVRARPGAGEARRGGSVLHPRPPDHEPASSSSSTTTTPSSTT